jgi:nitrite reductase/ring-hydroxylating ferredoxin subunit
MNTLNIQHLPYPEGWFCVGTSESIAAGQLKVVRFFGSDVIVYRTVGGRACVSDAYCPHMGAHFAYGGSVEGESLRCPFHGFEFSPEGECTRTGYNTTPPRDARLPQREVCERLGFIFAWYSPTGRSSQWQIPDGSEGRWLPNLTQSFTLRAHPQETTENSVDIGHLSVIHGYKDVGALSPLTTTGPHLHARYYMHRDAGFLGKAGELLRVEFEINAWGFGFSHVDAHVIGLGIHTNHFIFVTPQDEHTSTLTIGLRMEPLANPAQVHPALSLLPRAVVNEIIRRSTFAGFASDVKQDFDIWQNKVYVHPPRLATGDGPVMRYRQWARQFYPTAA